MTRITFLGTGTSNGIPMIGCRCQTCTSTDPRDRRGRTSAVIQWHGRTILLDTSTELRTQALREGLDRIDAVLFTHAHADHTGGFDDLRRFNELGQQRLPLYTGPETAEMLADRFAYGFDHAFPFFGGKPDLDLHVVDGPFDLFGEQVVPIPVWHGRLRVFGYRFGDLAYVTDAKTIPPESIQKLAGVDTLVINALRERPHPTHLNVEEALEVIAQVAPRRAWLVHLSHELAHAHGETLLPEGVGIAWDGLQVETAGG